MARTHLSTRKLSTRIGATGLAAVAAASVLGLAGCGKSSTSTPSVDPSRTKNHYTLAQVKQHNSKTSCWAAINGNVYDLTTWITQHPGGPDKILGICGTDATAAFNQQHSKDPEPHQKLAGFQIGVVHA